MALVASGRVRVRDARPGPARDALAGSRPPGRGARACLRSARNDRRAPPRAVADLAHSARPAAGAEAASPAERDSRKRGWESDAMRLRITYSGMPAATEDSPDSGVSSWRPWKPFLLSVLRGRAGSKAVALPRRLFGLRTPSEITGLLPSSARCTTLSGYRTLLRKPAYLPRAPSKLLDIQELMSATWQRRL